MPEGDSVHHAARRVHEVFAGRVLDRAELRVPRFAAVDLRGRIVDRAWACGKNLFIDVRPDAEGRDPVIVHVHLKMEGRIHVHRAGERWRFPAHTVRLVLATDGSSGAGGPGGGPGAENSGAEVVGTELGLLRALNRAEVAEVLASLGPDLLGQDWNPVEAVRRIAEQPDRTIGEALLDQRNLSGIGTIYRAEVCFLRGLDPRLPVGDVEDIRGVVDLARRLLAANVDRPSRVTTGITRRGRRLWVYGRDGRPCLRCGTLVEGFRLGGGAASLDRVAYRCPSCQPSRPSQSSRSS